MGVKENVAARKTAEGCYDLLTEYVLEQKLNPKATGAAWGHLARMINEIAKVQPPANDHCPSCIERLRPLPDDEAKDFEQDTMPFGKHAGDKIKDVPLSYLDYLVRQWEEDEFRNRLPRYLRSTMISSEVGDD